MAAFRGRCIDQCMLINGDWIFMENDHNNYSLSKLMPLAVLSNLGSRAQPQ